MSPRPLRARKMGREWALHFPAERDPAKLARILRSDRAGALAAEELADPAAREVLRAALPAIEEARETPFARIYYGAEFCEHLIPSPERLRRALETAREAGLPLTLLTPWVSDRGLARLRPLLDALEEEAGEGTEVVANDWGVLSLLRREHPGLRPVLGRLMNKMMRDPRTAPFYSDGPEEARRAMARSSLSLPIYTRFLKAMGVGRVELDALYQGIELCAEEMGLPATLYLPFGYVASGRICLSGSLHLPREDKFRFDLPCRHECQDWSVELRNVRSPFPESRGLTLFQRGNTVFYPQEGEELASALASLDRIGIDRVVLELDLPQ